MALISPHGADALRPLIVDAARRTELESEAKTLPKMMASSAAAANAVMMAAGYFTPLTGYMNRADALSVAKNMTTSEGLFWPVPVMNLAEGATVTAGQRLALTDPNREGHQVLAVMTVDAVETLSDDDMATILENVFRTDDPQHPCVAAMTAQGRTLISGPIEVLNFSYFEEDFAETFRTAMSIREEIAERGWERVVAFQTRNPMHRAHEELCRMAMEDLSADGVLIHMLLGTVNIQCQSTLGYVLVEDRLGVKTPVVATDTRMISSDDQVGAACILTEYGMQYCLSGPSIEHVKAITGHHDGIGRKV